MRPFPYNMQPSVDDGFFGVAPCVCLHPQDNTKTPRSSHCLQQEMPCVIRTSYTLMWSLLVIQLQQTIGMPTRADHVTRANGPSEFSVCAFAVPYLVDHAAPGTYVVQSNVIQTMGLCRKNQLLGVAWEAATSIQHGAFSGLVP